METLVHDPFATKGTEYLLVILFLVALPLFFRYLNGTPRLAASRVRAAQPLRSPIGWFRLPDTAYYGVGHTWAVPVGAGRVRIGLDDFAQKVLGPARSLELPEVGSALRKGNRGWALQVADRSFDLPSPVAGRVVARNEAALRDPGVINADPYGDGWLLEVEVPKLKKSLSRLHHGRSALEWLLRAEDALRLRMSPELGMVLQDGGVPVPGIARALSESRWDDLVRDLLYHD